MRSTILTILAVCLITILVVGCGTQKAVSGSLKDGEYKASDSKYDERGWKGEIKIVVKEGKITEVDYNEVNKDGKNKQDDADYNKNMKETAGTSPNEVFPKLERALVEKQDINKVDAVSGATGSSNKFKALAKEALVK